MTDDEIKDLAHLARLQLTPEEIRQIGPQLDRILGFVEQLSELDTDDIEPMTTALDVINRWSADVPASGLDRVDALANAPDHDSEYFLVPPVLGAASTPSK